MISGIGIFAGTFLGSAFATLVAWACIASTPRENSPVDPVKDIKPIKLPDSPISMEHEHGGENCDQS